MNINIKNVNTILYCKKWEETVLFYKSKLKLTVSFANQWFIEFKLNEGACLSIADEKRSSIVSCSGKGITVAIRVDDIQKAYSELKEAGLNPTEIKDHPWGAKVIYVYDPEDHRLEFWSQE